jgi:nitrite reductase (NO-forming)
LKFTKNSDKEKIMIVVSLCAILTGGITTTTAYGLSLQDSYNIDSLYSRDNIITNHSPTILEREGDDTSNYKNIISSNIFPTEGENQTQNTITSSTNGSNSKEFTMIAEDATMEISPGERVEVWTFNGTVPGPTLRFTEGDNITIHFINKAPMAHTLHLHGTHDSKNDGAFPLILPNQTYNYNFIAEPAGSFLYHCHAPPTSLHIKMGMYGSLIIDPKDSGILKPAREYALVLSEFDPEDQDSFVPKYYPVNGYTDQYTENNSLVARQNELVRFYISNPGTTIPFPFHLHSTIFKVYQSGLLSNEPIDVQTIPISPGDAIIVEATWKYPGTYLVHSHGIQEERGNMGEIDIIPESESSGSYMRAGTTTNSSYLEPVTNKSISMIDWQYQIQKKLQKPLISKSGMEEAEHAATIEEEAVSNTPRNTLAEEEQAHQQNLSAIDTSKGISIVSGAGNPDNDRFYEPSPAKVAVGSTVTWTNDDALPHTVTSGNPEKGPDGIFDSGILNADKSFSHTFDKAGVLDYYCAIHPWMTGRIIVQ